MENKTFNYYGYEYRTISENEVALIDAHRANDRTIIPSEVEDSDGKKYNVVEIDSTVVGYNYEYQPDRRRKPVIRYSSSLLAAFQTKKTSEGPIVGRSNFTEVILPDTIKTICPEAFSCSNLTQIVLPASLEEIPERCFYRCKNLKSIQLPEGLKVLGKHAFSYTELEDITIPSSVTHIDAFALNDGNDSSVTNHLKKVYILNNEGSVIIHPDAIADCAEIEYLGVPSTAKVTYHDKNASPIKTQTSKGKDESAPLFDVEKLMDAIVVDGVVTDKERSLLLKKATSAGYDPDEVEILLDAKLYEVQTNKKESKQTNHEAPKNNKPEKYKVIKSDTVTSDLPVNGIVVKGDQAKALGFVLNKNTTVSELKQQFNEKIGAVLRVYVGRSQADEDSTLGEVGLTSEGVFECTGNLQVGVFINRMAEEYGLKVKVYTADQWVAVIDGLTLSASGKVKKNATKVDMEKLL